MTMITSHNELFCAGLGFSARALILHLKNQPEEWRFSGCTRNTEKQSAFLDESISCVLFDGISPIKEPRALENITHLLISTAPTDDYADPFLHFHSERLKQMKNLKWIGYLSTTGVYGDQQGRLINEETQTRPTSTRGMQRLEAEELWQAQDLPLHIFRLSSIYGSGRGQLKSILSGRAKRIVKKNQYFSRIHVKDIAQILHASMMQPNPKRIYNLSDDDPCPPEEILDYLTQKLGLAPLPSVGVDDPILSPLMRSFYSESKKTDNQRIKKELGIKLKYPSYKEGYAPQLDKL